MESLKKPTISQQALGLLLQSPSKVDPLAEQISAAVDNGIIVNEKKREKRKYIGASSIGDECSRKIQYRYLNYPIDPDKEFSARTLRIFQFGHNIEDYAAKWLRDAGFDLRTEDKQGEQFGFSIANDQIKGHIDGVVCDEASQISRELIDEVIRPAIADRKGWMSLCSTPKGMNNIFYDMYLKAQSDDKWFLYTAKASETGLVDQEELDAALSVMGQATYNQEFECSFIGNVKGSIYGDLINKLEDERRFARVPHDPSYGVSTAWDLGYNDATAIIFYQNVGHAINIIDYYENNNQAFPHYAQILKEKDYVYAEHIGPHDLDNTDFTTGRTKREVAYQMGLRFKVAPKLSIEDGIHAVKMLLPRCYIDVDNCSKLINALRHYHRKFKEKDNIYSAKPNHDWSSHANDALRYLATGLERTKLTNKQIFQKDYNYEFSI